MKFVNIRSGLFSLLVAGGVLGQYAVAEDLKAPVTSAAKENGLPLAGSVADTIDRPGANSLLEAYNGYSKLFDGYNRVPIFFDSTRDGKERVYPILAYDDKRLSGSRARERSQKNSIRIYNLGVDDEVRKSALAVFTPLSTMQLDIANDTSMRQRYLDLFKTYNGIAQLTLSYLDKTVAAGLASVQAHVNATTQDQLLKQISWTSSQLANPQRAMLYRDVDEKLEACLHYGSKGMLTTPGRVLQESGRIQLNCNPTCLAEKAEIPTKMGTGLLNYCVCCAESTPELNFATKQKEHQSEGPYRSIVDAVVFGDSMPKSVGTDDKSNYIVKIRDEAREMYGDKVLTNCKKFPLSEGGVNVGYKPDDSNTCDEKAYKFEYHLPRFSVPDKINLFRNGTCEKGEGGEIIACPQTRTPIKEGICPAIEKILVASPAEREDKKEMTRLWVQASLGIVLTSRDIENMLKMGRPRLAGSRAPGDVSDKAVQWPPKLRRFLDDWCDASAVAAFKRYHYRMMALLEDHMRLNQKASEMEKAQFRELMDRVTLDIELAEKDRSAGSVAKAQLVGAEIEASRIEQGKLAASIEANQTNEDAFNNTFVFSGAPSNVPLRNKRLEGYGDVTIGDRFEEVDG